jgi:YgiT-type zinc finger domain-containing protein
VTNRDESIACPKCGGRAVYEGRTDTIEYKGHTAPVEAAGYWCTKCDEAVFDVDSLEKREQAFFGLRARVEGASARPR